MRNTGRCGAVSLLLFCAGAFWPAQRAHADAFEQLDDLNLRIDTALEKLKIGFGKDLEEEEDVLAEVRAAVDAIRGSLTEDLASAGEAFAIVKKNFRRLEEQLRYAELAHACTRMHRGILAVHLQSRPVATTELQAFDEAVASLEKTGEPSLQDDAEAFRAEGRKLRAENARLEELTAKIARLEGSRQAALRAQKESEDRVSGRAEKAFAAARQAREAVYASLAARDLPIPEEQLPALELAAHAVEPFSPQAEALMMSEVRFLRVVDEWLQVDEEALAAMARLLEAEPVAAGTLRAPSHAQSFNARADWCYAVLARSIRAKGASPGTFEIQPRGRAGSSLQSFTVWRDPRAAVVTGVCAPAAEPVALAASLAPEATGGARWVVLGWPKAKFPADLARHLAVRPGDPCDARLWASLWTDPVPGSTVYSNGEPRLVVDDLPEQPLVVRAPGFERIVLQRKGLTPRPTGGAVLPPAVPPMPACAPLESRAADVLALARCRRTLSAKFVKAAPGEGLSDRLALLPPSAPELAVWYSDRWRNEDARVCAPIQKRIEAAWDRTMRRALDELARTPPPERIDRPALMMECCALAATPAGK